MITRAALLLALAALPALAADWNPKLAAEYLDGRQKEWFAWSAAKAPGGVCISCHTGMTYLMARPVLRKALGETQPTEYEKGLLGSLAARVEKREIKDVFPSFSKEPIASQAVGVESIFAAMFLPDEPARSQAVARLRALQIREGESKGAWPWFNVNLDPWEMPESGFFGATLVAIANMPAEPDAAVKAYLQREYRNQPLHNRLMLLWANLSIPEKTSTISETIRAQQPDGGWTIESLGPWKKQEKAPPSAGSNSYATAFAALSLENGGVTRSNPALVRALNWLKAHQDRETGSWEAGSMNKVYPADSMMIRFMRDAATAYASMALIKAETVMRP